MDEPPPTVSISPATAEESKAVSPLRFATALHKVRPLKFHSTIHWLPSCSESPTEILLVKHTPCHPSSDGTNYKVSLLEAQQLCHTKHLMMFAEKAQKILPAALLCLLGAYWTVASYMLHLDVNMTLRRELSSFNIQMVGALDAVRPDSEFSKSGLWDLMAFEGNDDQALVKGPHSRKTVLRGIRSDETFEEMSIRMRGQLVIPIWPGPVGFLVGFLFLAFGLNRPYKAETNQGTSPPPWNYANV